MLHRWPNLASRADLQLPAPRWTAPDHKQKQLHRGRTRAHLPLPAPRRTNRGTEKKPRMLHRTLRHDFAESEGLVDNSRNLDPIVKREQRQKAAELCRKTWAKLQKAREQAMLRSGHTSNFGLNSGEFLVLAAECCAKNGLFDDARDCAEEFFVDDCATSQGSQDQFLCRAKFVQAQVECNNAKPYKAPTVSEGDASRGATSSTR